MALKTSIEINAKDNTKAATNSAKKNVDGLSKSVKGAVAAFGLIGAIRLGTNLISEFAKLDTAIRKAAAVTGEFERAFPLFAAAARKMGETTQFTSLQAAESLQKLAQAGLGVEGSLQALPVVLNLSAASGTDLANSADIVTNIMGGYQIAVEGLVKVSDTLTKTVTSSNTSLSELGFAFSFVGGIAKSAGQDFDEINALLGVLANNGFKATNGGTALRGAFVRLLKPAAETQAALDRVGVSVKDSRGQMRSMINILEDLNKSGADTTDIIEIFGAIAGKAMVGLVNQGSDSVRNLVAKIKSAQGVTKKTADEMASGLGGTLKLLSSKLDDVTKSMGEAFAGDTIDSARTFIDVLDRIKPTAVGLASSISGALAKVINFINGFRGFDILGVGIAALIKTGIVFAALFGVKIVASLLKMAAGSSGVITSLGFIAKANIRVAQSEVNLAKVRVKTTQAMLGQSFASGREVKLKEQLTIQTAALTAAEERLIAVQEAQTLATEAQTLSMESLLSVTTLLNVVFLAFLSFEFGKWARENSTVVQKFGIVVAALATEVIELFNIFLNPFSSKSLKNNDIGQIAKVYKEQFNEVGAESIKSAEERIINEKKVAKKTVELAKIESEELKAGLEKRKADLEQAVTFRKEQYDRDFANFNQAEKLKIIELESSNLSASEIEQKRTALIIENNTKRVQLAKQLADINIAESNRIFDDEIKVFQDLNRATTGIERDKATKKKEFLGQVETAYRASIDRLISLEQKLASKAKALRKSVVDQQQSFNDRLKNLNEIGLSDAQVIENRKIELAKISRDVRQAISQKDFETANALGKKQLSLAFEIATAQKNAGQDSSRAERELLQIQNTRQQVSVKLANDAQAQADKAKTALAGQQIELNGIQKKIATILDSLNTIKSEKIVKIKIDSSELDTLTAKLNSLPSGVSVDVSVTSNNVKKFAKGFIPKYFANGFIPKGRDTIPAMIDPREAVITADTVKRVTPQFLQGLERGLSPIQAAAQASGGKIKDSVSVNLSIGGNKAAFVADRTNDSLSILEALKQAKLVEG